jgi:hypothetical protein
MIDKLGFGPIHVLGSSLGGSMALALAQRHLGKLKSLMVVGGFSELDRATELNFRLRLRLIEKLGMSDEVADYMGLWTLTRKFINSDAGYATMRANQDIIRANSAESYSAFVEALLKWGRCQPGQEREAKFTTLLDSIALPTLVVTSDNDHLIPKELSDLIAARIAGAKLVVMPGAGHIPFMEQPAEVVRIIARFSRTGRLMFAHELLLKRIVRRWAPVQWSRTRASAGPARGSTALRIRIFHRAHYPCELPTMPIPIPRRRFGCLKPLPAQSLPKRGRTRLDRERGQPRH